MLLAEGKPREALAELRRSWSLWCELEAPYEAARVRVLIALASRALGDEERRPLGTDRGAPARSKAWARWSTFLAWKTLFSTGERNAAGPLTGREVQVLRLVAAGMTNRGIAGELEISEKTVARHLSNIFTKLDLSSRTAAAAYAYDHGLV